MTDKKPDFIRRLERWEGKWPFGPGHLCDVRTFSGNLLGLLFWCVATYFLWHFDEVFAWYRNLRGAPYQIDPAKQSWARLWAVIIGGGGILFTLFLLIMLPINRHRARKSAEGQWYDNPNLTKRELGIEDKAKPDDAE